MPIDKFGILFKKSRAEPYNQCIQLFRNYVRNNALCVVATDFDAKSRKIRRTSDSNVANNRYVQQSMQILKDWQNKIEKKIAALQNSV